jgi:hypothetical protein
LPDCRIAGLIVDWRIDDGGFRRLSIADLALESAIGSPIGNQTIGNQFGNPAIWQWAMR